MKIGLLTFHYADNYGALLQAWALSGYLRTLGHAATFIDYRPYRDSIGSLLRLPIRAWRFKWKFRVFRSACFRTTRRYEGRMPDVKEHFGQYWVGSDQVWNPTYFRFLDGSVNTTYFFDFLPDNAVKVSYAASVGEGQWGESAKKIASLIKRFHAVSLREDYAEERVKAISDVRTCVAPDPVFLLDREHYERLAMHVRVQKGVRRVFVYGIAAAERCLEELAKEMKCGGSSMARAAILNFRFRLPKVDRTSYITPTPQEWLGEIMDADFIITDSFHCAAFAIIFRRPFRFVYKKFEVRTNERVLTLLSKLGISDTEHPDWRRVDESLSGYRSTGRSYIEQALSIGGGKEGNVDSDD